MGDGPRAGLVAERLLQVIDEGRRTATYKLALALALIDACAENTTARGEPPAALTTRQVAEHVVRLYLPQVRQYVTVQGTPVEHEGHPLLLQLRAKDPTRAVSVRAVYALHVRTGGQINAEMVRARHPDEYATCVDQVELNFARYPLLLFQVLGGERFEFLYTVDWTESVGRRSLAEGTCGRLTFLPGAASELVRLAPLLRPLIEFHWVRQVAVWNGLDRETEHLQGHLFGVRRGPVPVWLTEGLRELQSRTCFYCDGRMPGAAEVDHFLPWSRWPNDSIENLVLAHRRCNNDKRDLLAGGEHVHRWCSRLKARGAELQAMVDGRGWVSDPVRSLGLMRAGYAHIVPGTPLWVGPGHAEAQDLTSIRERLAGLLLP